MEYTPAIRMPAFSREKLMQAYRALFPALPDEPDASRRQFLKQTGAAAVAAVAPELPVAALTPTAAIEQAAQWYIAKVSPKDLGWRGGFHSNGTMVVDGWDDTVKRLLDPIYREIVPHAQKNAAFPLATNSDEAIQAMERLIAHEAEVRWTRDFALERYLVEHPDQINAIAGAVENTPGQALYCRAVDVRHELRRTLEKYHSMEPIQEFIASRSQSTRIAQSVPLYRRFGVTMPGLNEEDIAKVRKRVESQQRHQWKSADASAQVRRYAVDEVDGQTMPTYRLSMQFPEGMSADEQSHRYHRMIARLTTDYPTQLQLLSDVNIVRDIQPGKLLLTPTENGLLISLPPGWEHTQFQPLHRALESPELKIRPLLHTRSR